MLCGGATHNNFIVFDLTRPGLESTIYSYRIKLAKHNYTTDAVRNDFISDSNM